jgi:hypothetical protein
MFEQKKSKQNRRKHLSLIYITILLSEVIGMYGSHKSQEVIHEFIPQLNNTF